VGVLGGDWGGEDKRIVTKKYPYGNSSNMAFKTNGVEGVGEGWGSKGGKGYSGIVSQQGTLRKVLEKEKRRANKTRRGFSLNGKWALVLKKTKRGNSKGDNRWMKKKESPWERSGGFENCRGNHNRRAKPLQRNRHNQKAAKKSNNYEGGRRKGVDGAYGLVGWRQAAHLFISRLKERSGGSLTRVGAFSSSRIEGEGSWGRWSIRKTRS